MKQSILAAPANAAVAPPPPIPRVEEARGASAEEGTPLLSGAQRRRRPLVRQRGPPPQRPKRNFLQKILCCCPCNCCSGIIYTNSAIPIVALALVAGQLALNAALSTFLGIGLPANLNITLPNDTLLTTMPPFTTLPPFTTQPDTTMVPFTSAPPPTTPVPFSSTQAPSPTPASHNHTPIGTLIGLGIVGGLVLVIIVIYALIGRWIVNKYRARVDP